jgi:hypothetical protein
MDMATSATRELAANLRGPSTPEIANTHYFFCGTWMMILFLRTNITRLVN